VPRLSRVIAIDIPHHVTQRGNARRFVFDSDPDRLVYLDLLSQFSLLYHLSVAGFCLMSNHVHLIVVLHRPDSLEKQGDGKTGDGKTGEEKQGTDGKFPRLFWPLRHLSACPGFPASSLSMFPIMSPSAVMRAALSLTPILTV
jgi:REP element-mobilizing transposase RayT